MSAPLKLTADELDRLGNALARLSRMRNELGVDLGYHPAISIGDVTLSISWDVALEQWVVDDRSGS